MHLPSFRRAAAATVALFALAGCERTSPTLSTGAEARAWSGVNPRNLIFVADTTRAPRASMSVAGIGELITNGGFENGFTGWTKSVTGYGINGVAANGLIIAAHDNFSYCCITHPEAINHSGAVGLSAIENGSTDHRVYQDVQLPATTTPLNLSYFMRWKTAGNSWTASDEDIRVTIRNPATDAVLATLWSAKGNNAPMFSGSSITNSAYLPFTFNLSAYQGTKVRISFEVYVCCTYLLVDLDDVSLTGPSNQAPVASAGGPYNGVEGADVALSPVSSDPDGDALSYTWNFGDGITGAGASLPTSHRYANNGSYTFSFTALDPNGASAASSAQVLITNAAPTVNAGSDVAVSGGSSLTVNASFADAGINDGPWSYSINWGDNSALTTGSAATQATAIGGSHAYAAPGAYTVKITVTDKDGASTTGSFIATVANRAPTADAGSNNTSHDAYVGAEGVAVSFTGAGVDADGDALTYVWSFSDGTSASGASASHVFADNGSYTATLVVTDSHGAATAATVPVQIANVNPQATFTAPTAALNEGSTFQLSLVGATDVAADMATLKYAFDCGTGSFGAAGSSPTATCDANDNGSYAVRGRVIDKDGGAMEYAATVSAVNVAPTASFVASSTVAEGSSISLALNGATDASPIDRQSLAYAFDCGNGFVASASSTSSCATTDNGTRTVRGQVKDKDGAVSEYSATVTVTNVAPTVMLTAGQTTLTSGQSYTLAGTFTDPGADTHSYKIDWGVGSPSTGSTTGTVSGSRQYLAAGTYTVLLTVTDDDAAQGSASVVVTVSRLAVGMLVKGSSTAAPLNLKSNGDVPVSILSSASFDARTVDVASIRIGTAGVDKKNNGTFQSSLEDVNGDGRLDLVLHFSNQALIAGGELNASTTTLHLNANLVDGRQVNAESDVRIVP